jgi:hypothetical protein
LLINEFDLDRSVEATASIAAGLHKNNYCCPSGEDPLGLSKSAQLPYRAGGYSRRQTCFAYRSASGARCGRFWLVIENENRDGRH